MGAHHSSIDAPHSAVDISQSIQSMQQMPKDVVPEILNHPTAKSIVNRFPRAKLRGQITPRTASTQDPENSVNYRAMTAPGTPTTLCLLRWQEISDCIELSIREIMT